MKAVGGVELDEAGNGAEAVRRVREGGAYDLILADRQMPVMDGHEVRACAMAFDWYVELTGYGPAPAGTGVRAGD